MFPTPHTVTHNKRVKTGENAHGQPIYTKSGRVRPVYGWQPPYASPTSNQEENAASQSGRTIASLVLLTPDGDYGPNDEVIINGVAYEVWGDAVDYNAGPFSFAPGYAVNLRKVTNGGT